MSSPKQEGDHLKAGHPPAGESSVCTINVVGSLIYNVINC